MAGCFAGPTFNLLVGLGCSFLWKVLLSGPFTLHFDQRAYISLSFLYLGLGLSYLGLFVGGAEFDAPAFDPTPAGAPPMLPFVFILIACGAASGFHGLVSSGTTAKQLDRETDARAVAEPPAGNGRRSAKGCMSGARRAAIPRLGDNY